LQKKILRTLTQAKYSDKNEGHFGLWIEHYSHFTSPIRRYPDLQIHRIIKEKLSGRLDEKRISHYKGMLSEIWEHASAKEREAEKLEYKVRDHFVVELYKERIWEEFEATISGVISSWFFVALPDSAEGFVKVENAHFDEIYQSLQFGKNKHSLWQKVKVRLVSADEFRSKLYFDLI
jgi:ribonuclease R